MLSQALLAVIVIAVVGFYAGMNPGIYARALLSLVPGRHRARAEQVANEVAYTLRWWLLGQLVPMVVLGAASMIGLWLLGVPLAFTLGLITGIMIFVPYLGTLLSEVPAVLVALKQGPTKRCMSFFST
jgi:predicted PurR-regulated permease PerM